ncbi:MAG: class I SAM-dependent methyltransferase [Oscillatoriophycideae cyanobacterium NC_groundwater_1537_Pr4_S-0.65um_50_18]|nr:class I SAM-dependent methyltransferase [Oscillatoriophycideae cyanobacterium NC_groundwater_1537_Pr4_S-0.65um_50_18]
MSLYSRMILPCVLDWAMSDPALTRHRQDLLSEVRGETLEIGFGTGLNLPYYPDRIQNITAIDANAGMSNIAQKRIQLAPITVDHRVLNGEHLPMADCTFDSVVSTWTLCSIAKVDLALKEIHRVLKPGGQFFFVEHGLSPDPKIQVWQHRLTPLQKVIADGCHLDRNIQALIEQEFATVKLEQFQAQGISQIAGYLYKGMATKT